MRFERGKSVKEAIDVGLSSKILKISWTSFYIGIYNEETGRHNNIIFDIKLELLKDYLESQAAILDLYSKSPIEYKDLFQYVKIPNKFNRKKFRERIKEGRKLILLVELGADELSNPDGFSDIEYVEAQGKIYPIFGGPRFIRYPEYKPWYMKLWNKIIGQ